MHRRRRSRECLISLISYLSGPSATDNYFACTEKRTNEWERKGREESIERKRESIICRCEKKTSEIIKIEKKEGWKKGAVQWRVNRKRKGLSICVYILCVCWKRTFIGICKVTNKQVMSEFMLVRWLYVQRHCTFKSLRIFTYNSTKHRKHKNYCARVRVQKCNTNDIITDCEWSSLTISPIVVNTCLICCCCEIYFRKTEYEIQIFRLQ